MSTSPNERVLRRYPNGVLYLELGGDKAAPRWRFRYITNSALHQSPRLHPSLSVYSPWATAAHWAFIEVIAVGLLTRAEKHFGVTGTF